MSKSTKSRTFDDIVFEGRNKSYGAYQLRRGYNSTLNRSMLITMGAFGLFAGLLLAFRSAPVPVKPEITGIVDVMNFKTEDPLPPLKNDMPKPRAVTPDVPVVQPLDNTFKPVTTPVPDVVTPAAGSGTETRPDAGAGTGTGTGTDVTSTGPTTGNPGFDSPIDAVTADIAPAFPGGLEAFYEYLGKKVNYTIQAREIGVHGKVYATFIIGPDGKPREAHILKGLGYGLDEQVISALLKSPAWSPGMYKGKAVSVIYRIPVNFTLAK